MSLNKVHLIGNCGKDPDLRYTNSGDAVATFSLATTSTFKNREGSRQTEWHNIVAWKQLAEICGKYLKKGKKVYIEGRIQTRSYDDNSGNKRYVTEIIANQMQMLDTRSQENNQQGGHGKHYNQGQNQGYDGGQQQNYNQQDNYQGGGRYSEPSFDPQDDIPFAFMPEFKEIK